MQPCHTEPEAREQRTYSEMRCNLGDALGDLSLFWRFRNESIKGFLACFKNDCIECKLLT
jgi:hypothetical protein